MLLADAGWDIHGMVYLIIRIANKYGADVPECLILDLEILN